MRRDNSGEHDSWPAVLDKAAGAARGDRAMMPCSPDGIIVDRKRSPRASRHDAVGTGGPRRCDSSQPVDPRNEPG